MKGILKDLIRVTLTNIIILFIGIIIGFINPKYLSINDYAFYKTYTLILSLICISHLGFSEDPKNILT